MENFNEISKKYQKYAIKESFLGVEDFLNKDNFNLSQKKSFNYSYQNIIKNRDFPSISSIEDLLEAFEKKTSNKAILEEYFEIYEDIIKSLDRVKEIHENKVFNDNKAYKINQNISSYKEALDYLVKSNNQYKEKRINTLELKIKESNKEIRKLKRELTLLTKENRLFTEKIDLLKRIIVDLDKSEKIIKTQSDLYVNSLDKNMITKFLTDKTINFIKWEFSKSQKIEEVLFFEDDTIAIKDKEGYKSIKPLDENYNTLAQEVFKNVIAYTYRKKPNYISKVNDLMSLDKYNLSKAYTLSQNFLEHEQILKNNGFNLMDELNLVLLSKKPSLELIDDKMSKIILNYKVMKLANSIISQKYKHLYDKKSEIYFKELYDLKISEEMLQNMIGRKIAGFKTPKDLNNALGLFINSMNNFDVESIKKKALNFNTKLCIETENSLVIRINDFEASKNLGSSSWCISRNKSYFDSYSDENRYQYFYFDFNKDSKSNLSMIGFTIEKNGKMHTAHIKNDDYINFEEKYKNVYINTIVSEIEKYNLSKDKIKEFGIEEKIKNKQKIGF